MNSREWDIYTITSACGNWSISARAVYVHSVCHLSLVFADLQRKETVSVTEKKHGFKLKKDFESDSFTVFSGENLLLSFIVKDSKVHLVLNAPDLVLPDGRKGVTVNVGLKGGRIAGFEKKGRKSVYSGFMSTEWRFGETSALETTMSMPYPGICLQASTGDAARWPMEKKDAA